MPVFMFRHHEGGPVLRHMQRASRYESCALVCTHLCVSSQCTQQLHMACADALQDGLCAHIHASTKHREHTTLMILGVCFFTYAAW